MEAPENATALLRKKTSSVGPALLWFRTRVIDISREQLARELGVSSKTIYRWERMEAFPNPLACEKLAILAYDGRKFIDFFEYFRKLPERNWQGMVVPDQHRDTEQG